MIGDADCSPLIRSLVLDGVQEVRYKAMAVVAHELIIFCLIDVCSSLKCVIPSCCQIIWTVCIRHGALGCSCCGGAAWRPSLHALGAELTVPCWMSKCKVVDADEERSRKIEDDAVRCADAHMPNEGGHP